MAMIEAYRIGVELVLGGDLAAGIEALIPQLARLDDSLAQANAEAKGLAAGLAGVAGTAPGVGQAADAMERLNRAMGAMNQAADRWRAGGGLAAMALPAATVGEAGVRSVVAGGASARRRGEWVERRLAERDDSPSVAPRVTRPGNSLGQRDQQAELVSPRETAAPVTRTLAQAIHPITQTNVASPSIEAVRAMPVPPPARNTRADAVIQPVISTRDVATAQDQGGPAWPSVPRGQMITDTPNRRFLDAAVTPIAAKAVPEMAPLVMERVIPAVALTGLHPESARPAPAQEAGERSAPHRQRAFAALRDDMLPQVGEARAVVRGSQDTAVSEGPTRHRIPSPPAPPEFGFLRDDPIAPVKSLPLLRDHGRTIGNRRSIAADPVPGWPSFRAALRETVQEPRGATPEPRSKLVADLVGVATSAAAPKPAWGSTNGTPRVIPDGLPDRRGPVPRGDPLERLRPYHPPHSQAGPVIEHVTYVQLDERTIARAVTRQQLRMMGGQVSGTLRPDPSIAPQYGAHLLES